MHFLSTATLLSLLAASATATQSPDPDTRVIITLADGARVVGRLDLPSIVVSGELGELRIPLDQVRSITTTHDGSFSVKTDRSTIVGAIKPEDLVVQTELGPITVPFSRVQTLAVQLDAGPEPGQARPADLTASALVNLHCTFRDLVPSIDGKSLYLFDATDHRILRLDTATRKLDRVLVRLDDQALGVRPSADGKTLYAFAPDGDRKKPNPGAGGIVQVVDLAGMTIKSTFVVDFDPSDLAADARDLLLLCGKGPAGEDFAVVDPAKRAIVARWTEGHQASILGLSPDRKRVYATGTTSWSPLASATLPDDLSTARPGFRNADQRQGLVSCAFTISPDGKFLIAVSGPILRLARTQAEDLAHVANVGAHLSSAVDPARGLLLISTHDGWLHRYSYPQMKKIRSTYVRFPIYRMSIDAGGRVLYAASEAARSASQPSEPMGGLAIYDLDPLLEQPPPPAGPAVTIPTTGGSELKPFAEHPMGSTFRELLASKDGKSFFALNSSDGTIHRVRAESGQLDPATAELPAGLTDGCLSPDGKRLYAFGPGDEGGGRIHVIDAETLAVLRSHPTEVPAFHAECDPQGRLLVSSSGGPRSELSLIDLERKSVVARWGLENDRSFFRLTPDAKRVILSPGCWWLVLPDDAAKGRPVRGRAPFGDRRPFEGEFIVAPDGKLVIAQGGAVLRLAPGEVDDLTFAGTIDPHLAAVIDPAKNLLLTAGADALLRVYSLPDLKLLKCHRTERPLYRVALDPSSGTLCAAVDAGPDRADGIRRPRGIGNLALYRIPEK